MHRVVAVCVALCLSLSAAVAHAAPASTAVPGDPEGWPDTRAGVMARGWVQAFSSGEPAMKAFLASSMAERSLAAKPLPQRVERYRDLREKYGSRKARALLTYDAARRNHLQTDWDNLRLAAPWFVGRRLVNPAIEELIPFIDWTFFFSAWELKGRFPAILDHPDYGPAARDLYEQAQTILASIVRDKRIQARGVYGFWPAAADGDDIIVYTDDARNAELTRFHMLRQQEPIADGRPNRSLADFIAPKASFAPDYIGAFAVTAGIGAGELVKEYEAQHDDYNAIIVKAIADRLAEAFAEFLHAQARHDWGYGKDERLSREDLIAEKYRGIRPAFGYPACPDHTEKDELFRLLRAREIGMDLTESFAMTPPASVSGLYFSHPEARYFNVGRIGRDQLEDYARRKGMTIEDAERWLAPNLG
jgi:5-methyltetrahydrofolate--homocysteine methyltransferase